MVTKTIPSKPKAKKKDKDLEAKLAAEQDTLSPQQEAAAKEKAKALTKKLADDKVFLKKIFCFYVIYSIFVYKRSFSKHAIETYI